MINVVPGINEFNFDTIISIIIVNVVVYCATDSSMNSIDATDKVKL